MWRAASPTGSVGDLDYYYQPLDRSRQQIRLLRRTQATTTESAWSLEHWNLQDAPPYRALSYAWGDVKPIRRFVIDRRDIFIRQNLFDFFAYVDGDDIGDFLWVDQICIDQNSVLERNHQVSLMADIYRGATEIIVWLGLESMGTREVVNIINSCDAQNDVLSVLDDAGYTNWAWALTRDPYAVWAMHTISVEPSEETTMELSGVCLSYFRDFFGRDYWFRLWPVQELLLARKIVVFIYSTRVSWDKLKVLERGLKEYFPREEIIPDAVAYLLRHAPSSENSTHYRYEDLVDRFSLHECADIRDKLYGLSSLIEKRHRPCVDYTQSPMETYHTAIDLLLDDWANEVPHKAFLNRTLTTCFLLAMAMAREIEGSRDQANAIDHDTGARVTGNTSIMAEAGSHHDDERWHQMSLHEREPTHRSPDKWKHLYNMDQVLSDLDSGETDTLDQSKLRRRASELAEHLEFVLWPSYHSSADALKHAYARIVAKDAQEYLCEFFKDPAHFNVYAVHVPYESTKPHSQKDSEYAGSKDGNIRIEDRSAADGDADDSDVGEGTWDDGDAEGSEYAFPKYAYMPPARSLLRNDLAQASPTPTHNQAVADRVASSSNMSATDAAADEQDRELFEAMLVRKVW